MKRKYICCSGNSAKEIAKIMLTTFFREILQIYHLRRLDSEKIFGKKSSLFNTKWQRLKKSREDYFTFAGIVYRMCERSKLKELLPSDMWKKKWVGESVTYVLRALFRGILWPTWMSISFWYLWSELRVGGVRGDYNLYIQVQSPLSVFSLNCVIKETRPLFFLLQNFR